MDKIGISRLAGLGDRWEKEIRQSFGRAANNFQPPDSFEAEFSRQLVSDIQECVGQPSRTQGGLEALNQRAATVGLHLSKIVTEKEEFVLLDEVQPTKGWGKVLFRTGPCDPLVLEVPHPGFDARTPELGIELFEQSRASVLVMAGAHRLNSSQPSGEQPERQISDPAHSTSTFFHAAHQGLEQPGQTVLQIHGFAARSDKDPQAVMSDGRDDSYDPPALTALSSEFNAAKISHQVVNFEEDWLTARSNVQGQSMEQKGLTGQGGPSQFVHLELEASMRTDPAKFQSVVQALGHWSRQIFSQNHTPLP